MITFLEVFIIYFGVGVCFRDAQGNCWLVNECVTAFVEPLFKLFLNRNKWKNL